MLLSGPSAADDFANVDVAVEKGREALTRSPNYPWYDEATDSLRPANVKPPKPPKPARRGGLVSDMLVFAIWALLAALLAALLYLIARAYLNREASEADVVVTAAVGGDISRVEELPVVLSSAPADFLTEAERLYRAGDYAQAIIYLFSHQLLGLDRRHWVRLVKGKTNRQYVREVRRSPAATANELASVFQRTVLLFEEVFFGKRLPPQESIDRCWQEIEQFESLLQTRDEAAAEDHAA